MNVLRPGAHLIFYHLGVHGGFLLGQVQFFYEVVNWNFFFYFLFSDVRERARARVRERGWSIANPLCVRERVWSIENSLCVRERVWSIANSLCVRERVWSITNSLCVRERVWSIANSLFGYKNLCCLLVHDVPRWCVFNVAMGFGFRCLHLSKVLHPVALHSIVHIPSLRY